MNVPTTDHNSPQEAAEAPGRARHEPGSGAGCNSSPASTQQAPSRPRPPARRAALPSWRSVTTALAGIFLASLLTLEAGAQNQHYRWVDGQGETVYSDRPPPAGTDYEIVSSASGHARAVSAREGAEQATAGEAAPAVAGDTQAEQARRKAELCSKARANLEVLKGSSQIVVRGPDGKPRTLTAEEVTQQRKTAESQVNAYCD